MSNVDSVNFNIAFAFAMAFEDPKCQCVIVPDVGGHAISGINSAAFPAEYAVIADASPSARALMVRNFYLDHFWNRWLESLHDIELAKRVFDAGINMGAETAVRVLQKALNIKEDGAWGPNTLGTANSASNAVGLVIAARVAHYQDIVAKHPDKAVYLDEWLARARK